MEWLFLLIPIVAAGIAKAVYERDLVWWELLLPFGVGIVAIFSMRAVAMHATTADTEYHGGYVVEANHYEPWDEEVACTHTKYKKVRRNGREEDVPDGTKHPYDIESHREYWEVVDSNKKNWTNLNSSEFEALCSEWKNQRYVKIYRPSLHPRPFSPNMTGNKYQADWNQKYETLHCTVVEHSYENRVAASKNVFNPREVSEDERKQYHLFDYPRVSGRPDFCPSVLGYEHPGNFDLDKTNAQIGRQHQIRIWLLCFKDQTMQAAISQQDYWKNGNKNELVVCAGLDQENKVRWGYVFSWTDKEDFKITTRQWIEDRTGQVLDVKAFNDFIKTHVEKNWERKQFKDFSYIDVELPGWGYWLIFFSVLLSTGGSLAYGVNNEYRD